MRKNSVIRKVCHLVLGVPLIMPHRVLCVYCYVQCPWTCTEHFLSCLQVYCRKWHHTNVWQHWHLNLKHICFLLSFPWFAIFTENVILCIVKAIKHGHGASLRPSLGARWWWWWWWMPKLHSVLILVSYCEAVSAAIAIERLTFKLKHVVLRSRSLPCVIWS